MAVREVEEESGIGGVRPLSEDIFSLEILTVDGHEKRGLYVPSHLHLNVTYLLEADDTAAVTIKPDENSGVAWFTPEEAVAASTEPWFQERIYTKLNRKLGRDGNELIHGEDRKGGIALANVNSRIHLLFGEEYGLHVYSVPQKGTDVEVTIPFQMD